MILVDSGLLYAYVDLTDQHHREALNFLETYEDTLVVPMLVIPEVVYLLVSRLGTRAEARFLEDLTGGNFSIEPVEPDDWNRVAELVRVYDDMPLGTVDASIVAAAERLRITEVATFDRRHFGAVRPSHVDAFELLP